MKILHTSDWHLGKMIYGRSLLEDQAYFITNSFFSAIETHQPDVIMIAGDIFDRQIAPTEAIRLFDFVLTKIASLQIPLLIISGNHDSADRLGLGTAMLKNSGIYFATKVEDAFTPVTIKVKDETIDFYLLPFCQPAEIRHFFKDDSITGAQNAYRAIMESITPSLNTNNTNVLITHCFAAGSATCDSETTQFVGGSGEVNPSLFAPFTYVALGHLHGPQKVGSNGRYSGSPLKYSFDEANHKKSMALLEITNQSFSSTLLPITPLHDMEKLSGTLEELLEQGKKQKNENYLEITLTNPNPVSMPIEKLRPYYPNIFLVLADWLSFRRKEQPEDMQTPEKRQAMTEQIIFTEFYTQICGLTATKTEENLFLKLLKSAQDDESKEEVT